MACDITSATHLCAYTEFVWVDKQTNKQTNTVVCFEIKHISIQDCLMFTAFITSFLSSAKQI